MDIQRRKYENRNMSFYSRKMQLLTDGCIFMHQSVDFKYFVFFLTSQSCATLYSGLI